MRMQWQAVSIPTFEAFFSKNINFLAEIGKKTRIINRTKSKIAEIETTEIEECLYTN